MVFFGLGLSLDLGLLLRGRTEGSEVGRGTEERGRKSQIGEEGEEEKRGLWLRLGLSLRGGRCACGFS